MPGIVALLATITANLLMAIGFLPLVPVTRRAIELARQGQEITAAQINMMVDPSTTGVPLTIAFWLGAGAFLLGIFAAVTKRGRGWGVVAILASIMGPILVSLFWTVMVTAGAQ